MLTLCGPCADLVPLEKKSGDVFSGKNKPQPHRPISEAILTEAMLLLGEKELFVLNYDFCEIV